MKTNAKPQASFQDPAAAPVFFSTNVVAARRFYFNLTPPKRTALAVICGGVEKCAPDYNIHRTTFPFYAIEYVARGRGTLTMGGREHTLLPGRLFSYGPGVAHQIRSDPANPLVKYFTDFTGTTARQLLREANLLPGRVGHLFPPHAAQGLFDELISCGTGDSRRNAELCRRLLECVLVKIADARGPVEDNETRPFQTYQQCRQHIQQHYARLRTLEELARECHIGAAYLCRLFRRYDHQSPYQFLLRLKLNAAADLLKSPDSLVKQVAEQIGFADSFHFSRTFKAVFGLSPAAFRRML